ncbi:883_t:CDS:2 [Funneliformis geosporum]|uniref:883_t:CDS:1 n=1 Tax=Funneliformis geosporum TaxID=1117311 RepID=A0A9W4T2P1_9GLOM|nr:883_t:CDS:2 [Funneliformis geosporum]
MSKLLDPDKYFEDNDMEEDLKDFTVVTKATSFAVANIKGVSVCHANLARSVIVYFTISDVTAATLHVTIPDLKIDTFYDFSQYKADMQFNEKNIHIIDILLQIKPANIKQVFAKYGTITDFKMIVRVWSRFVQNDSIRINPCTLSPEEIKYRNTYHIKLTNLPFSISARDFYDIILAIKPELVIFLDAITIN